MTEQIDDTSFNIQAARYNPETHASIQAWLDKKLKESGLAKPEEKVTLGLDAILLSPYHEILEGELSDNLGISAKNRSIIALVQGVSSFGTKHGVRVFSGDFKPDVTQPTELRSTVSFYSVYTSDPEVISQEAAEIVARANVALHDFGSTVQLPELRPGT